MPSFQANGNIGPNLFVKLDTSAAGKVLQATANDPIVGISQPGTRRAPLDGWDDGYAAIAGETLHVWGEYDNDYCWLVIGTGGCTIGDQLKSDANGAGVTTTTETDNAGAFALETTLAGSLCKVRVRQKKHL